MINKRWQSKPKVISYVLGTIVLSLVLSGVAIWATKLKIFQPMTAVSTEKLTTSPVVTAEISQEYKQKVINEINKVTTISAQIKSADGWLSLELPKINLLIDFNK